MEAWIDNTCPGYWYGIQTIMEIPTYSPSHVAAVRSLLSYMAEDTGGEMMDRWVWHAEMRTMKYINDSENFRPVTR